MLGVGWKQLHLVPLAVALHLCRYPEPETDRCDDFCVDARVKSDVLSLGVVHFVHLAAGVAHLAESEQQVERQRRASGDV